MGDKVAFLPWVGASSTALLNLQAENKEMRGQFKKVIWGGKSKSSLFDPELLDLIQCIYLPPLRDAESKLSNGRHSRLSKPDTTSGKTPASNLQKVILLKFEIPLTRIHKNFDYKNKPYVGCGQAERIGQVDAKSKYCKKPGNNHNGEIDTRPGSSHELDSVINFPNQWEPKRGI